MKSPFSVATEEGAAFELFSNVVLKFCALLIVMLVFLALNVTAKFDTLISPNRFSGGIIRPRVFVGAYHDPVILEAILEESKGQSKGRDIIVISLESPSAAAAHTTVDLRTNKDVIDHLKSSFSELSPV